MTHWRTFCREPPCAKADAGIAEADPRVPGVAATTTASSEQFVLLGLWTSRAQGAPVSCGEVQVNYNVDAGANCRYEGWLSDGACAKACIFIG